jgi:hypothetical protein
MCLGFPSYSSSLFLSEQCDSQGSPLTLILCLFYNADLIDACNSPSITATSIGFCDDANVLAFGKNTEETCFILKDIHSRYLTRGDMHGVSFAPHRYVIICQETT